MRAFLGLAALALAACYAFDDGRQQSWSFQTQGASELSRRATTQLARAGYQVLHADDRLIEAEKQRDAGFFDVLSVIVEGAGDDGRRVRVQAVSEEGSGGSRKQSRSVSGSTLVDGQALVDALMTRSVPPL